MERLFVRQFSVSDASKNFIPQCGPVNISIPTSPPTTPPYTILAYSPGTVTSAYPLTLSGQFASWAAVVYSAGNTLALNVVDSKGVSVGYAKEFTVQNGSTACLPPARSKPAIKTTIDLSDTGPSVCTPLIIHMEGGQKPYSASIVPVDVSATAYNMSLGNNDDTLYWVNTFSLATGFYVSISDSQGVNGASEKFISVNGSTSDTNNCPGQLTHSFNSKDPTSNNTIATPPTSNTNSTSNNTGNDRNGSGGNGNNQNNTVQIAAIVGGIVGAILLILIFILYRRRKKYGGVLKGMVFWKRGRYNKAPPKYSEELLDPVLITPYMPSTSSAYPDAPSSSAFSHHQVPSSSFTPTGNTNPAGRKAIQERGVPVSRLMDDNVQVQQHPGAGRVLELPPAYGDVPMD